MAAREESLAGVSAKITLKTKNTSGLKHVRLASCSLSGIHGIISMKCGNHTVHALWRFESISYDTTSASKRQQQ